jgi:hypothetical protein
MMRRELAPFGQQGVWVNQHGRADHEQGNS